MALHRRLPVREVAFHALSTRQYYIGTLGLLGLCLCFLYVLITTSLTASLMVVFLVGSIVAAIRVLQTVVLGTAGIFHTYQKAVIPADKELPSYLVLAPIYKEKLNTITALINNLKALDYPQDKLEILILVDRSDEVSKASLDDIEITFLMPSNMRVLEVADAIPGKPKALCAGFAQAHTADIVCIYDAEDKPDPDQLKKAAALFMSPGNEKVGCVQARLEFWDRKRTFVTHFMWNEYSIHFRRLIRGMKKLGLVIPLGGTSNHFRVTALREIAQGSKDASNYLPTEMQRTIGEHLAWDPFNMTEDADLGFALFQFGWSILPVDSATTEEAPLTVKAALKQRTRWYKGYMQTVLVALRRPVSTIRTMGLWRYLNFIIFVGGTPVSIAMFPFSLALTITVASDSDTVMKGMFPEELRHYFIVAACAVILLVALSVIDCISRRAYSSIPVMLMLPFWWLVLAGAAFRALWEMRSYETRISWSHTEHGVNLPSEIKEDSVGLIGALREKVRK